MLTSCGLFVVLSWLCVVLLFRCGGLVLQFVFVVMLGFRCVLLVGLSLGLDVVIPLLFFVCIYAFGFVMLLRLLLFCCAAVLDC